MKGATERQLEVLVMLDDLTDISPPSIRELAKALGMTSTNSVYEHLNRLKKKGLVRRGRDRTTRAWGLTELGRAAASAKRAADAYEEVSA